MTARSEYPEVRAAEAFRREVLAAMESPPTRAEALGQAADRLGEIRAELGELHSDLFLEPELQGAVAAIEAALAATATSVGRVYADARYAEVV